MLFRDFIILGSKYWDSVLPIHLVFCEFDYYQPLNQSEKNIE